MDKIKIYVVGSSVNYASWIKDSELVDTQEQADIVLFTGGEDVDPSIYGHSNISSYTNKTRDIKEKAIFEKMKPTQLALGICRGSQLLCCLNGGKLYQDVKGHAIGSTHGITDGKRLLEITSTHHQMQYPFNLPTSSYTILWQSTRRLSGHYTWGGSESYHEIPPCEPEIVEYHVKDKPVSLAIQGHPEMMRVTSPTIDELNKLVRSCLKHIKLRNS